MDYLNYLKAGIFGAILALLSVKFGQGFFYGAVFTLLFLIDSKK